jgi:hypothetical protein
VKKVKYTVPRMAGKIPPSRMPWLGSAVRNSHEMAGRPLTRIKPRIKKIGVIVIRVTKVNPAKPAIWMALRRDALEERNLAGFTND